MKIVPKPFNIEIHKGNCLISKIRKTNNTNLEKEEYTIEINDGVATISASSDNGYFYAEKTIEQLKASNNVIKNCKIHDKPKYEYRSFMIDCARHYFSIDEIKKIVDSMSKLKFNKFHWHLTDDQGWRIEINTFPKINTKSAIRPYSNFGKKVDNNPYGIVYTKEEMKEIVSYCKERFIDVVPEFDTPGHTSALLYAINELACGDKNVEIKTRQGIYKDVLCPANDKTYDVVFKIFDEICDIFPYEYYHIGGDETPSKQWESCDYCNKLMNELGLTSYKEYHNYYLNKIIEHLASKGKTCIAWNEASSGKILDKSCVIQYWKERHKDSIEFVNNGGKIILSPFSYYYMDYDYDITAMNHTYSFNPEIKGMKKENILGVEVPIWTEYIDSDDRLEEMLFPRAIAVANTAWGYKFKNYRQFIENITPSIELLKKNNVNIMAEENWTKPHITMIKGWLKFVFKNYSFEYIKSSLK